MSRLLPGSISRCGSVVLALLLGAGCEGVAPQDEGGVDRIQSALTNGTVATDANLKVAFVGDTADGAN